MLPHAWWLLAGAVAFYLYDAVQMLYHNEVVLYQTRRGHWTFSLGSDMELARRHAWLPAWWAPWRPMLRLRWSTHEPHAPVSPVRGLHRWRVATRVVGWPVRAIGLLFLLMPAAVYSHILVLLGWMVTLYAAIVWAAVATWRVRRAAGLAGRHAAGLVSDAVLCAPFALNTVRKMGTHVANQLPLVAVAHQLLDATQRQRLASAIRQRLDLQMALEDTGSERHAHLHTYVHYIEEALA